MTVEDLAVLWLRQVDVAPSTLTTYRSVIERHIMCQIGNVRLAQLRQATVHEWMSNLRSQGVGPDPRGRSLMYLRMLMRHGIAIGEIQHDPTLGVKKPTVPAAVPKIALSPKQVESIAAHMSRPEDVMMLRLMAYAGLRPGELAQLRWEHVQKRSLIVRAPKTNRVDAVQMIEPLAANLRDFRMLAGRPASAQPIFPGRWTKSDHDNWRKRIFSGAAVAAGWGEETSRQRPTGRSETHYRATVTPYIMRHSFASLLIHAGYPLTYVAQQMRHSIEMTMKRYAHVIADLDPRELIDPAAQISQAQGERKGNRGEM